METTVPPAPNVQQLDEKKPTPASPLESKRVDSASYVTTAAGGAAWLSQNHLEVLQNRGLDVEMVVKLGWKSSSKLRGDAIEIPYMQNGMVVNRKYRTITGAKRFLQDQRGVKCFYNFDAIKQAGDEAIVITEGEMDCVIALQCGYLAISVPDGAPAATVDPEADSVKYTYLEPLLRTKNILILAVDSDPAGNNLLHDLAIRLGKHRCKWVKYPKGCKDLNDTFMAYGKRGVDAVMARAEFIKVDGVFRMSELPPEPAYEALPMPISGLDGKLKLRRGDFSILTGIPSHGKSTFANVLTCNMAKKYGWNIAFASFEQTPQTHHRNNIRSIYHSKPHWFQSPEEIALADAWIDEKFSFIVPDLDSDTEADLAWLMQKCAASIIRHNADMVVIDPWNEIDHTYDRGMTITQYTGFAIKQFKKLARKYHVHVMVIAHPAKMQRAKDGGVPIPTLYDVSDSAHWYNKPDLGMIIHRQGTAETLLRVAKSRYHIEIGKPDDYIMKYDAYTRQYTVNNQTVDNLVNYYDAER